MDNSLISKNYFPRCLFFSRIIHMQRSYICRWYKVGFSHNTGARKQNTHTHTHTHTHAPNTQRKITPGKVSWYENK